MVGMSSSLRNVPSWCCIVSGVSVGCMFAVGSICWRAFNRARRIRRLSKRPDCEELG
jgi:hypothetical protein